MKTHDERVARRADRDERDRRASAVALDKPSRLPAAATLSAGLLLLAGLLWPAGWPPPDAQAPGRRRRRIGAGVGANGKQIFETSCVHATAQTCRVSPTAGPSLVGVGEAAVYFQVDTGRMPAQSQGAQAPQKPPNFDENQIEA